MQNRRDSGARNDNCVITYFILKTNIYIFIAIALLVRSLLGNTSVEWSMKCYETRGMERKEDKSINKLFEIPQTG